jgi:hypothetical protein
MVATGGIKTPLLSATPGCWRVPALGICAFLTQCLHGSPLAEEALAYALAVFDCEVTVLNVVTAVTARKPTRLLVGS